MNDCDIPNTDLTTTFTTSSINSENINAESKKRKTHRLKQRFQVVRKLGQGTYGKVQLAINNETGQEVAIKTIKKSKVSNQQDLIRIRREIQIMSSINHPNIIHIFEVFENKDKIVLVMQYASGGELYDYVSYNKVLSDTEARRVFRQIATAIYYCHKNKICHRDLKLENILLDEKGNAKIADFGLSNVFDDKHFLQTFCGSPLYASPEIVRGLPYFGPEVDCWSLGVLLYTLVYGAMPFDGSNFKKLVKQISEANYFEPTEKSGASNLIHKLLTPDPKERASIIDICTDEWVNQDSEHLLLQVAEDLSNLTKHAVRLDMLLALAPGTPTEQKTASLNEEQNKEEMDVFKKRPKETPLTNDSLAEMAGKTTGKKKSKKSLSNDQSINLIGENRSDDNVKQELSKNEIKSEQIGSNMVKSTKPTVHEQDELKNTGEIVQAKCDSMTNINENKVKAKTEIKSNESSTSSIGKRRGKLSIPDIWNPEKDIELSSPTKERKEPILSGYFSVSELKKELEEKAAANKLDKRRGTLADTSELGVTAKTENVKRYQNRSLSLNLIENISTEAISKIVNDDKKMQIDLVKEKKANKENSMELKVCKEAEDKSNITPASSISSVSNNKSLAKQIIQKNIAKAKIMEKSQTSIDSGETTPLISIENSTISVLQNSPDSASTAASSSNVFFKKVLENEQNRKIKNNMDRNELNETPPIQLPINSTPISRSYKKVIFTKDGAKITETGKFYSHEGDNGVTTRVETTSRVTHMINNSPGSMNIQRSDSQSSTGSIDIFEDIFDDHWTGDNLFSNVKSLFSDFFGCSAEKLSLRSRAESLERTNWFPEKSNDNIKNSRSKFLNDNFNNSSNLFGSQKSLFTSKSIFSNSSFSKSNFGKEFNFDDIMSTARSKIDTYKKYGFIGNQISDNNEKDFFQTRQLLNEMDAKPELESNKNRIEQWLDNNDDDGTSFDQLNMNTYGTIRPRNAVRRYSRTMTSNDYKSDIFKKVQISNSSSCQVIKQKTSTIRTENVIPRNSDIHINFSLDDSLGKLIISQSGLELNDSKKSSTTNTDNLTDLKIEEPSSLLEQLRTFGYKKMVNRRLSDSSSNEDILQAGITTTSSSMATASTITTTESTSTVSNKSSALTEEIAENVERNVYETMKMFHNDKEWQMVNDYRYRTINTQDYMNTETVEERIHRKSYYSRFNDTLDISRQRRRSATRANEYCYGTNFLPRSTSSSSTTSIDRHFYRPKLNNNSFDSKRCLYTLTNKNKPNLTFNENSTNNDKH